MRLTLFVDHACNLRCTYCYNGEKFTKAMPVDLAKAAVDMVVNSDRPLKQVGFFGGEPLMRFDLMKEVTAHVRATTTHYERPVTMVVTTNATLFDNDKLDWMKANTFHVGVSLDGCPEAHDACRVLTNGKGSYAQVAAGIKGVIDHDLPIKSISVIDPVAVDYMPQSLDHMLGLGLRHMSFNLNYEGDWNEANRTRFEAAIEGLADSYVEAYRRGIAFRLNLLDSKIITHVKMGFSCADMCDFGCEELAVAPSGNLYPCDRLIGEDDRDDVIIGTVKDGVDPVRRDALIADKNKVLGECTDCDLAHRCMHWCGCVNYAMTGSVGGVSGLLCWFEQAVIEAADRAAETLYAEKNPGFIKRFYKHAL